MAALFPKVNYKEIQSQKPDNWWLLFSVNQEKKQKIAVVRTISLLEIILQSRSIQVGHRWSSTLNENIWIRKRGDELEFNRRDKGNCWIAIYHRKGSFLEIVKIDGRGNRLITDQSRDHISSDEHSRFTDSSRVKGKVRSWVDAWALYKVDKWAELKWLHLFLSSTHN